MDPITLALIGGALVSGGSAFMANRSQKKQAEKNIDFQKWQNEQNWIQQNIMYNQQRSDAIADWNAQNEYNHPAEQMNRLRQAGLNPNLVYGKGADATAESVRATQFQANNRPAPYDTYNAAGLANVVGNTVNNTLSQYYDLKAKQAQVDNLAQNTALQQQEVLFKQANTAKTIADTASSKFELGQAQELKDSVIENAKLQNEKLRADTQYTLDNNQRSELANSSNVQLTLEKIITEKIAHAKDQAQIDLFKQQLQNVKQTNDILRYEQKLTEMGIHKSDPWYFRAMMNLINGGIDSPVHNLLEKINPSGVPEYNPKLEQQWNKRK